MRKKAIAAAGLFLFCAFLAINPLRDTIIIQFGIRAWKIAHIASIAFSAAGFTAVLYGALDLFQKNRGKKKGEIVREAQLDTGKSLVNHELRGIFGELLSEEDWESDYEMSTLGHKFIDQMKQIDDYQDRLARLLSTNAMKNEMGDWIDILDNAENKMCLTMRKGINCLQVFSHADRKQALAKINEYVQDNERILEQVKGFVYAATEFINHRGDAAYNEISEIGVYKDALLDVLEDNF